MRKILRVMLVILAFSSICFGFNTAFQPVIGNSNPNNSSTNSWPMYQNDQRHSGYTPTMGPLGNQTLWKYTTNDTFWTTPTIANGILYAGSDDHGTVYALNASTGTLLWRYITTGAISSSPAVADDVLYVGYVGGFCALNASNGGFLWNFATPYLETYCSPVVSNGVVYTAGDRNVYALAVATGSTIWCFPTNDYIFWAPAIDNGLVFASSTDKNVYALNAINGSLCWKFTAKNYISSSPAIEDGVVYIGSDDGYFYALNEATGQTLWRYATTLWTYDGVGYRAGCSVAGGAIANGRVYFSAGDNNVYALDKVTGAKIWSYHIGRYANRPAVVAGNEVFVAGDDRYLYALDAETGQEVWKYTTGSVIMSSPSVVDGVVYVGSDDGSIYAIGGETISYGSGPIAKPTAAPPPTPIIPNSTRSPLPTPVLSPSPTPTPTPRTTFGFELSGNVTMSQMSNISLVTNQTATKLSFTVTGESGTFGFSNITIAKNRIPRAITPVIYIDNTRVPEQGYTEDANNYYVWYSIHFSTHNIIIEFNQDTAVSPQATTPTSGINYQSMIYGLAIVFVIVISISIIVKLTLKEKKKHQQLNLSASQ